MTVSLIKFYILDMLRKRSENADLKKKILMPAKRHKFSKQKLPLFSKSIYMHTSQILPFPKKENQKM